MARSRVALTHMPFYCFIDQQDDMKATPKIGIGIGIGIGKIRIKSGQCKKKQIKNFNQRERDR